MTKKTSGSEGSTVWTEVATVAIKRGISGDGGAPLVLTQQVGGGSLRDGRHFDVLLSLTDGSLIIYLDPVTGEKEDKSRMYLVSPRNMLDAIISAEFPEL